MMSGVKYDYDLTEKFKLAKAREFPYEACALYQDTGRASNRETRRNASFFTKAKFLNKYKSCLTLNR
ncbi:hypothetical protein [Aminipila luticellarii]|uniref:Uncharacterized protein n=1 Tax=Aminipila luticellarii TaxID=2507160 RepID=A0A410PU25_9FIRM|nr:hypothetical protein [Aminipila luticellarii]QAT42378.1 hypothetical protein EQM06_03540 [Aminipila luticellarii]QAT43939.1 hypothetical protein EQM06_12290 [Aminipila luticellarii]